MGTKRDVETLVNLEKDLVAKEQLLRNIESGANQVVGQINYLTDKIADMKGEKKEPKKNEPPKGN